MKKMLVLALLLAVASLANAVDFQIRVNGQHGSIDLSPSGNADLSLYTDNVWSSANTMALIVSSNVGRITGGTPNPAYDGTGDALVFIGGNYGDGVIDPPFAQPSGLNGIWGGTAVFAGSLASGTLLISDIEFHCEAPGDATIQLIQLDDMTGQATGLVYDSIVIHQTIPEPATMLLLGLGGLALKRFKK